MAFDRHRAQAFVKRWQAAKGDEEKEFRSYVIELMEDVLAIEGPTRLVDFERSVKRRHIDAFWEDQGILIEGKSRGTDLDKPRDNGPYGFETPYQQAKWYYANLPRSVAPRWLLVSNFDTWRVYDLDQDDPEGSMVEVTLEELGTAPGAAVLDMFLDRSQSRIVKEQELSVAAGEVVGRLYDAFAHQYRNLETDPEEQRSLNVLTVRLVFLLYAEDAGLMPTHQAVYKWLNRFPADAFRNALIRLFEVLDTPEDERDPYLDPELLAFPYVDGSLFADKSVVVPQVDNSLRYVLLEEASRHFDWAKISPTIFGAVFESTLNPGTRRAGGMHYTSIENIHKVIDPLFLDGLKAELTEIEGLKTERSRKQRLRAFQDRLAAIQVLDPACGSGNFLTETYLSLRRLENRAIEGVQEGQTAMLLDGVESPVKVSITQMHGIEINDFAVSVARTALWIAEAQMLDETQEILYSGGSDAVLDFLPLTTNAEIMEGNALRMDWNTVLPATECSYVIGNPPFVGAKLMTADQKRQIVSLFGRKVRLVSSIDYVSGWFYKAAEYVHGTQARCAFVATNSICQGQQVAPIWRTIMNRFGLRIDFAWRTFTWDNEASEQAHVHVVIIGFSWKGAPSPEFCWIFEGADAHACSHVNAYLADAEDVFVESTASPISAPKPCDYGSLINDGGLYIFKPDQLKDFLKQEPEAAQYVRPLVGSDELIKGKKRFILYLKGVPQSVIESMPEVKRRVEGVREKRLASTAEATRNSAERPQTYFTDATTDQRFLCIPSVSSENRDYVPMAFVEPEWVPTNLVSLVPGATLTEFGVLTSSAHNAWMRAVAGRLEMRYRYAPKTVYNTFPWPHLSPQQATVIGELAQAVLDTRAAHQGKTLAQLYDRNTIPADLLEAHKALDAAVLDAYGLPADATEEQIVGHLFELYAELTV